MAWLILSRGPGSLRLRVVWAFGYFFAFEYAVISRSYVLGALFLLLGVESRGDLAFRLRKAAAVAFLPVATLAAWFARNNVVAGRTTEYFSQIGAANPEAMPVANGLIVEPMVPIPQPRRTTAAPVSAS